MKFFNKLSIPKSKKNRKRRSGFKAWFYDILFAVVFASLVHAFVFKPYIIPTSSMEKTLLVGDFIFVSKWHYGPRVPMTPLAFPFVHNTLPFTNLPSYIASVMLDYYRIPGFYDIKRNDVVVFNYPVEADPPHSRPVDRRENYIKRCVGLPGDVLRLEDGDLYVNDALNFLAPHSLLTYFVQEDGTGFSHKFWKKVDLQGKSAPIGPAQYLLSLTDEGRQLFRSQSNVLTITRYTTPKEYTSNEFFPNNEHLFPANNDHFNAITIPAKGMKVELNTQTVALYKRCITVYEGHTFEEKESGYYIDGELAENYTFLMDYYWMMGDNRHNSLDSRFWGFVPEDHIVGKALFIWMSWDSKGKFFSKIRWDRIFDKIK